MAGIRQDVPQPQKKRAAPPALRRELLVTIPDDLRDKRDRALFLVGFAIAQRRSELTGIKLSDFQRPDGGYKLTLWRSKGSQIDAVLVAIPYGRTEMWPVRALAHWLTAAATTDGPVLQRIWLPPSVGTAIPPSPPHGRLRSLGALLHSPRHPVQGGPGRLHT
jgi:site-specific recombinase XerC